MTVLLSLATACSASPAPESTSAATPTPSRASLADLAPPPAQRCSRPEDTTATKAVVTASDGTRLAAAEWGDGPHGVVLLPQRGGDLCGWYDYATELGAGGFHVLAVDFRRSAFSDGGETTDLTLDVVGAVEWLRAAGATRIVLIGASMGATAAMVTVGRHPDLVDGLVTLSLPPRISVTGGDNTPPASPEEAAPLIQVPMLMCWSTADRSAVDPHPFLDAAPATDKRIETREGTAHGWVLVRGGAWDVRPQVLAFLRQYA